MLTIILLPESRTVDKNAEIATVGDIVKSLGHGRLAPLLWLPYAVWVTREATLRRAAAAAARIGVLTLGTSLWWVATILALLSMCG